MENKNLRSPKGLTSAFSDTGVRLEAVISFRPDGLPVVSSVAAPMSSSVKTLMGRIAPALFCELAECEAADGSKFYANTGYVELYNQGRVESVTF